MSLLLDNHIGSATKTNGNVPRGCKSIDMRRRHRGATECGAVLFGGGRAASGISLLPDKLSGISQEIRTVHIAVEIRRHASRAFSCGNDESS
jgi:hypothetical protein